MHDIGLTRHKILSYLKHTQAVVYKPWTDHGVCNPWTDDLDRSKV